jgi:hypothetical protein
MKNATLRDLGGGGIGWYCHKSNIYVLMRKEMKITVRVKKSTKYGDRNFIPGIYFINPGW